MKTNNYVYGLDIGITSTGFAAIDADNRKLIEFGVRHFEEAEQAKISRLNRSARRLIDRKRWRKNQLKQAFADFGVLDINTINKEGFISFTYHGEDIERPKDETVYHLRKRALNEKVTLRELFLALYNICKTRGHFLLEDIDFISNEAINFEKFREQFYSFTEGLVDYVDDRFEFEENVLKPIFDKKLIKVNDIKSTVKKYRIVKSESTDALLELLKLITGFSCNFTKVSDDGSLFSDKNSLTIKAIKTLDSSEVTDFLAKAVELYDLIQVHSIMSNHQYICEVAVEELDRYTVMTKEKKDNADGFEDYKKQIRAKMHPKFEKADNDIIRVIKNLDNSYPNGIYLKEARAILYEQQKYYGKSVISDEFIEACLSIISARIPFFVGPLDENAKNAWIRNKEGKFKYSYDYTQKHSKAIDVKDTIKRWKERMISHCTYLPEEPALPKGSFIYETFNILNEMNNLYAEDINGDTYYLTKSDKERIFNDLFLKINNNIIFDEVKDLIGLSYFGARNNSSIKKFNNKYTIYHSIANILPELRINNIAEIYSDFKKVDEIENIILDINLFDEEKARRNNFAQQYGEQIAEKLGKLRSGGFYSLSRNFLMEETINEKGESIIDALFDDNSKDYANEQMTIITNAKDINGKAKNFTANKYYNILKDHDGRLSIDLLIDEGKPLIPISRGVIRGLNECFKVYEEMLRVYGVPRRIVVETAKEFNSDKKGEVKLSHRDEMKKIYDAIIKQLEDKKYASLRGSLDDWNDIEQYLDKNKQKVELYIKQLGLDMLSGDRIDIHKLSDYEIDHILSRGFGDDSMDDKMLVKKIHNSKKGDRVPLQYIEENTTLTAAAFIDRVEKMHDLKMISSKKKEMLLLKDTDDVNGFINRNLVDTRYIIKEFVAILEAYNNFNNFQSQIVCLNATFTNLARKAFGMRKNRDFGLQHHAHDAALLAIADTCLRVYYPNYESRGNFEAYQSFINGLRSDNIADKSVIIMRKAYEKVFREPYNFGASVVNQIKSIVPLYSEKVIKKGTGKYFDATIYGVDDSTQKDGPLYVLGVNNNKRRFDSVNCAAVDFYRYKDKKGKAKHVGIHIPKIIIDKNGNINQEKYKKLIKNFYKEDYLLDESGNIKEYLFRFRAFKNDIIYDTATYVPQLFNIGSIANRRLDLKHIDIFSYDDIYGQASILFKETASHFRLYDEKGKLVWDNYDPNDAVEYIMDYLGIKNIKHREAIVEKIVEKKKNKLRDLCETISYLYLWTIRPNNSDNIFGQYKPTINNRTIAKVSDAEYIKLKYSPLGIRYSNDVNGKLIINGPSGNNGAFSKIRKEKFSWKISKYSI